MNVYYRDITHIRTKAEELLKMLLRDGTVYEADVLKQAVEQLTRVVIDLAIIQSEENVDIETTLKATRAKIKIVYNLLEEKK